MAGYDHSRTGLRNHGAAGDHEHRMGRQDNGLVVHRIHQRVAYQHTYHDSRRIRAVESGDDNHPCEDYSRAVDRDGHSSHHMGQGDTHGVQLGNGNGTCHVLYHLARHRRAREA